MPSYETVGAMGDETSDANDTAITYTSIELPEQYTGEELRDGLAAAGDAVDGITYTEDDDTVHIASKDGITRVLPQRYRERLQAHVVDDHVYDAVGFDRIPGHGSIDDTAIDAFVDELTEALDR